MSLATRLPFLLHILIETPASYNFLANPPTSSSATAAIIRQYAALLFSSVLIAGIMLGRPLDRTSRRVAGALGVYHVAPIARAAVRLSHGESRTGGALGGPAVHLCVHVMCAVALGALFVGGRKGTRGKR